MSDQVPTLGSSSVSKRSKTEKGAGHEEDSEGRTFNFINYGDNTTNIVACTGVTVTQAVPEEFRTAFPVIDGPPSHFTGRVQFLRDLHALMVKCGAGGNLKSRMTVVTGLGGIGKSSVCKAYAAEYAEHYGGNVGWINAETESSARESFTYLARSLRIDNYAHLCKDNNVSLTELVDEVYGHVDKHKKEYLQVPPLFILDNANPMNGTCHSDFRLSECLSLKAFKFLPVILVSSRFKMWDLRIRKKALDKLSREETLDFISKALSIHLERDSSDSDSKLVSVPSSMETLAQKLDGFPLALRLAVSSISAALFSTEDLLEDIPMEDGDGDDEHEAERAATLEQKEREIWTYIAEFDLKAQAWLSRPLSEATDDEGYTQIMDSVWEITIQRIALARYPPPYQSQGQWALEMLRLSAYLPPDSISVRILHFLRKNIPVRMRNLEEFQMADALQVKLGLETLQTFSMVNAYPRATYRLAEARKEDGDLNYGYGYFFYQEGSGRFQIHRLVQKTARLKSQQPPIIEMNYHPGQAPDHQGQDEARVKARVNFWRSPQIDTCGGGLRKVARYVLANAEFFELSSRGGAFFILDHLTESKWVGGSWREFILISHAILAFIKSDVDKRAVLLSHLKTICGHLLEKDENDLNGRGRDEEFLTFCRLLSLQIHYAPIPSSIAPNMISLPMKLDNSNLFPKTDPFIKVRVDQLLSWTMGEAIKYSKNHWIQYLALQVFQRFHLHPELQVNQNTPNEFNQRLIEWFKKVSVEFKSVSKEQDVERAEENYPKIQDELNYLLWTFKDLFKLVSPLLGVPKSLAVVACIGKIGHELGSGARSGDCWEFFDKSIWRLHKFPRDLWSTEKEELSKNQYDEALGICRLILDPDCGVFNLLTARLRLFIQKFEEDEKIREEMKRLKKTDHWTTADGEDLYNTFKGTLIHPSRSFDIVAALAYFEETRGILLDSAEFLRELRSSISLVMKGCERQRKDIAMDVLNDALLCWFAIFQGTTARLQLELSGPFTLTFEDRKHCQEIFKKYRKSLRKIKQSFKALRTPEQSRARRRILFKFLSQSSSSATEMNVEVHKEGERRSSSASNKKPGDSCSSWTDLARMLLQFHEELEAAENLCTAPYILTQRELAHAAEMEESWTAVGNFLNELDEEIQMKASTCKK